MTTIIIVEDEAIAARHLQQLLAELQPDINCLATLQSIEESVEYFSSSPAPDLVFMDFHLADGLATHIFHQTTIDCPVIFTTAYDQYALDAFRAGGIDYLLKPIDRDALQRALDRARRYQLPATNFPIPATNYPSHFLVPVRNRLIPIEVKQIACIYLEDKITRAILYDGRQQIIDRPLDSLMSQLNPDTFFRANRQYIVAHHAIDDIALWPISKLAVTLRVPTPTRIIISKARVREFKQWYTK